MFNLNSPGRRSQVFDTGSATPRRPFGGAFLAWAVAVLVLALAYRGLHWLSQVGEDGAHPAGGRQDAGLSTDWAANAKRFEAEKGRVAAVFQAADKVEPLGIQSLFKSQRRLEDYPVVSRAASRGHDFAARLGTLLLDPKSYVLPGRDAKLCLFQPHVAFRVWAGSKHVDVLICFDCRQLMVIEDDPEVPERSLGDHRARFRVGGDFDPVAAEIEQLVREAFPGDRSVEEILGGPTSAGAPPGGAGP